MSENAQANTQLATPSPVSIRHTRPIIVVAAIALLLAACGGERPEFAVGDEGSTVPSVGQSVSTQPSEPIETIPASETTVSGLDSQPEVADTQQPMTLSDCITVVGPGPWPVAIEPTPEPNPRCGRVAAHHKITFSNNTPNTVSFELAGQPIAIEPGAQLTTEPIGTLAQTGLVPIDAVPFGVTSPWLIDVADDAMQSFQVLLGKFGPIVVGMTPEAAEEILGGNGLAKTEEAGCALSYMLGDPYSPLFTVRDGSITAIQIFTPGQQTRSGIGVGSTEVDIQTAYGENIVTEPAASGDPNQKLMVFVPTDEADGANRIVFALNNGVVTSLRTGVTEFIVAAPGC